MKIRKGFVSNSSSSSFVCSVCGDTQEGFGLSMSDIDYYECINGHVLCSDDVLIDLEENDIDDRYEMEEKYCPICQFIEPDYYFVGKYLGKKYSITRDEVFASVKSQNKRRKKLYDNEYVAYIIAKFNLNQQDIMNELKSKYNSFGDFRRFVNENS